MAPTPPNTTSRLKVHYSGPGAGSHVMLFHGSNPGDVVALTDVAAEFIAANLPLFWDGTTFSSAEYAAPGSPFFFPTDWTPQTADTVNVFGTDDNPAVFLQYGGRDGNGVRVKLYAYEIALVSNAKMRYDLGDQAAVDAALAVLDDSSASLKTIAGGTPAWKAYANWGVSDYHTHRARRAG